MIYYQCLPPGELKLKKHLPCVLSNVLYYNIVYKFNEKKSTLNKNLISILYICIHFVTMVTLRQCSTVTFLMKD